MIDPEFLKLLACPACGASLIEEEETLRCQGGEDCGRIYPVEDGIPVLLVEESWRAGESRPDSGQDSN